MKTWLIFFIVTVCVKNSLAQPATTEPATSVAPSPTEAKQQMMLNYTCEPSGDIVFNVTDNRLIGKGLNVYVYQNSSSNCSVNQVGKPDNSPYILTGCDENEPVHIFFSRYEHHIYAGDTREHLRIECDDIPTNGTIMRATFSDKHINDKNEIDEPTQKVSVSISMTVLTMENKPVLTLTIGQEYILDIVSQENYEPYPQKCSVSATGYNMTTGKFVIVSCNLNCSTESEIFQYFENKDGKKWRVSASLTGFRLVESSNLYLWCDVKVCPHGGCQPQEILKNKTTCMETTTTVPTTVPTTASTKTVDQKRRRRGIYKVNQVNSVSLHEERNLSIVKRSVALDSVSRKIKPSNHVVKLLLHVRNTKTQMSSAVTSHHGHFFSWWMTLSMALVVKSSLL